MRLLTATTLAATALALLAATGVVTQKAHPDAATPVGLQVWVTGGLGLTSARYNLSHGSLWVGLNRLVVGLRASSDFGRARGVVSGPSIHRRRAASALMGFRPVLRHDTFVLAGGVATAQGWDAACPACDTPRPEASLSLH